MSRILKRLSWALEYAALVAVLAVVRVTPERWWRAAGRGLGRFAFMVAGKRRDVVLDSLRHAFPDADAAWLRATALAVFTHLGVTMLEFFAMTHWSPEKILMRVERRGFELVQPLLDAGQGVLFATGHYGNWELLGAYAAAAGMPVSAVARSQTNPWVDRLQSGLREKAGLRIIKADASVRRVIRALRAGECVAMLPDVNAGDDGVFVDFLGRAASTPRGAALFAWKLGCPVVPAVMTALGDGRHRLEFTDPILPDRSLSEDEAVHTITQQLADRLAVSIRSRPEQYFWVHRRWKTRPPHEETKQT